MKYKTELRANAQLTKMSMSDMSEPINILKSSKSESFKPSESMVKSALEGLKIGGGSKLSTSLAQQMANGNSLSLAQVQRINKFFSKMTSTPELYVNEEINSQAANYMLHGGDEAQKWASEIISREDQLVKASNNIDPDLLRMKSVLVSQGMNLNDDVFLKEELIKARLTGANKPVNIEHDDSDIIGHMLQTYVVSKDGEKLEDIEDIDLEDEIDIVNEAVIYAYIFPEIATRIQELASQNNLFVSVEAWFSEYDYLVGSEIVKRSESTASFLEKHLRINGGDGSYQGKKVARVLRNIMFGGVGVVATPANPESLIIEVGDVENAMASEEVVLASHVIGIFKESNDLREVLKEENMENEVEKDDLDPTTDESSLDLQGQQQEDHISEETTPCVNASDSDSTEDSQEEVSETVSSESDDVVEASSQDDVETDEEVETDGNDSIEASTEEEADNSEVDTESSEGGEQDTAEAQLGHDGDLHGAHDHPEIMAKVGELESVVSMMTEMLSKQNAIIAALDEKVVLLESETVISQRHKDLVEAGLTEDLIASRIQKVVLMDKEEFSSYIDDIKGLVTASNSVEEKEEIIPDKTIASSDVDTSEDSEINLDTIEPTSTEINVEEINPEDNSSYNKFLKVVSSMVTENKKRRIR